MDHTFSHALGNLVRISASGEEGYVIGMAAYETSEDHYLIRYRAGDGRAVEQWWGASALSAD